MNENLNMIDLWYTPHKNQWSTLGYDSYEEVESDFGGAFFQYDESGEDRVDQRAALKTSQIENSLVNSATKAGLQYDMQEKISKFQSEHANSVLNREQEFMKDQTNRSRAIDTSNALLSMFKNQNTSAKYGIKSGGMQAAKQNAVDNITSKIDSSLASSNFKRAKIKNKLNKINKKLGSFSDEGTWEPGSDLTNLSNSQSIDAKLLEGSRDDAVALIDFDAEASKAKLYDDWIVGSLNMFQNIMFNTPQGPNSGNVENLENLENTELENIRIQETLEDGYIEDNAVYFDTSEYFEEENCVTNLNGSTTCY